MSALVKRILMIVVAVLFVGLKCMSLAHATEHDDHHHEHDGVACSFVLSAHDEVVTTPTLIIEPRTEYSETTFNADFVSSIYVINSGLSPPPRSPPSLST
jgi:hypothetical protein